VERLHKTMRAEFFRSHERELVTIAELQATLDRWVEHDNTERPHQAVGRCPPADRFRLAAAEKVRAMPGDAAGEPDHPVAATPGHQRPPGVSRWVDQAGKVRPARSRWPGSGIRSVGSSTGEPVKVVATGGLIEVWHAGVLVATHPHHRRPDARPERQPVTGRRARRPALGPSVTRIADSSGAVSFAGVMYRAGRPRARRSLDVSPVAGSVQLACDGQLIRVHPARHHPAKEHGAFATPNGRPRNPRTVARDDHVALLPELIRHPGTGT
jgi:hypothetical protein